MWTEEKVISEMHLLENPVILVFIRPAFFSSSSLVMKAGVRMESALHEGRRRSWPLSEEDFALQ